MEQTSIFRVAGGRVRLCRRSSSRRVILFFAGRDGCGPDARDNDGCRFASRHGLNAALIQPFRPRWYQARLAQTLPLALRRVARRFDHVTCAGEGMGAYGALFAAQHLRVDHVIAVRPVATLNGTHAPATEAERADFDELGADLEPLLTHRAGRYTVFAEPGAGERQADRLYLPSDRTERLGTDRLTGEGPFGLPEDLLLDLLGEEEAPRQPAYA
ncbi:hypothetical protein [Histidinibacterium aquaticum]|uniref:Alpha/beta hydrolase n=1 Tax=Histidinibacterium aquaticum TaxID=2613962 RepID=A0A5J5GPS8_9RHOB|nr:hypothetical protein [Histidinibacterium aquaticum]KAA9010057.1 hypothetical protein F3S47_02040 [Histidinibacterium aquaticum]